MCDPLSLTVAGTAISAGGALYSGYSSMQSGRANAAGMRVQSALIKEKAGADIAAEERKFTRTDGALRNQIASSGVSAASFSDVLADTAAEKALALRTIAWGAQNNINNLNHQANAAETGANNAMIAGVIRAGAAVAGGGANYYQQSGLNRTSISSSFE